ncbi:autism susceptibility candidate 2 (predicted), isoform CRA_a [Rattus norvegicus]|uniref:Autism susceptibility candidate 2 (Predicted), isoform CRA_a n=1 Tax=Rattus norvegicus TaxID=10116 RepID=A6J0L1_RAT|nr:autism susceptibility candidate 2 (predicted), isoform CRA_a [Rattus norvegicus]
MACPFTQRRADSATRTTTAQIEKMTAISASTLGRERRCLRESDSSSQDRTAAGTATVKALVENPRVSRGAALGRGSAIVQLLPAWGQATSSGSLFSETCSQKFPSE